MFGINGSEFLVLLAVAAVVLGPERLPQYTQQLTRLIRELRRMALGAQEKVREELGPDFDDVDWRALDPRRYDPRRIVREALSDAVDLDDPLGIRDYGRDDAGPGRRTTGSVSMPGNMTGNASGNGAGPVAASPATTARQIPDDAGRDAHGPGLAFDPDAT